MAKDQQKKSLINNKKIYSKYEFHSNMESGVVIMEKDEKIKLIKWYIKNYCCLSEIQTKKDNTDDLKELEQLVANERDPYIHISYCSQCLHGNKDYIKKCYDCKCGSKFTFPYAYWLKVYNRKSINE